MTKEKDVLLQTRVPTRVAREVKRRADDGGDSDASWLRKLLVRETAASVPEQGDAFFGLGHQFVRKSSILAMHWRDPHRGTCSEGRDPWQLEVLLVNGTNLWLSSTPAAIVLKSFGLPPENPYPKGTEK